MLRSLHLIVRLEKSLQLLWLQQTLKMGIMIVMRVRRLSMTSKQVSLTASAVKLLREVRGGW